MEAANDMYREDVEYVPVDIFTAAQLGDLSRVKQCITNGVDMNEVNSGGWSALHYSTYLGHKHVCKYLIDSGAHINLPNGAGCTALMLASMCGLEQCVQLMLLSPDSDLRAGDKKGYTALMHAVTMRHLNVMTMLLSVGADPNTPDGSKSGITPLMMAAAMGHDDEFELLLSHGGDISQRTNDGKYTAYSLALTNKRMPIVSMMDKHIRKAKNGNMRANHSVLDGPRLMAAKMNRRGGGGNSTFVRPSNFRPPTAIGELDDEDSTPTRANPRRNVTLTGSSGAPPALHLPAANSTLSTTASNASMLNTTASNASMLNTTRSVGGIAPDGPLPTHLRQWLIDDLRVATKHYDSLMVAHPSLTVATFVQMTEEAIKQCVKTIGPRRKMVVAIKAYHDRVALQGQESDVESATSSNGNTSVVMSVKCQQVYKRMFEETKRKFDEYRETTDRRLESQQRHICLLKNTVKQHAVNMSEIQTALRGMHIEQLRAGNTNGCDLVMKIKEYMELVARQLQPTQLDAAQPY